MPPRPTTFGHDEPSDEEIEHLLHLANMADAIVHGDLIVIVHTPLPSHDDDSVRAFLERVTSQNRN